MGAGSEILAELRQLRAEVAEVKALLLRGASGPAAAPAGAPAIAPDSDLDSQYGDPAITRDPPRWKGEPVAPCKLSEAPAAWLDCFAEFKDWAAARDEASPDEAQRKKATYSRRDAARARGWAARARAKAAAMPPEEL